MPQPSETKTQWLMRTLWRIAVAAGVLIALVGFFYTVENWRGRRAYDQVSRELTAKGESLDWKRFIPPTVPDDQNFTRTPFWETYGYRTNTAPPNWIQGRTLPAVFHLMGDWSIGQPVDFTNMHQVVRGIYATDATPPGRTAAARDVLEAFQPFEPEIQEWRVASVRPYSQFRFDPENIFSGITPNFVAVRQAVQILNVHANAHLAIDHAADAATDLRAIHQIAEGLRQQPTLVAAMIRVAIIGGPELQVVWEGLQSGQWTDAQLAEIQRRLEKVNLIEDVAWALRGGERAGIIRLVEDAHARMELGNVMMLETNDYLGRLALQASPEGWRKQNMATHARLIQLSLAGLAATNGTLNPEIVDKAMATINAEISAWSPYHLLARVGIPNTSKALLNTARNQDYVQMAVLVCALERHRRASGSCPPALEDLIPKYLAKVPHDSTAGQPLKYRRQEDGRFLLYAVGWNVKDDGGVTHTNRAQGDWLWPARNQP